VRRIESPWSESSARRCEGLILAAEGNLDAALAAFACAVRLHEHLPQPFDLARTLLAQGTVRRRARRRKEARDTLQQALDIFEGLGARLWAEKARGELGRIGGRAASRGDLTPAERRIAELVAAGKTNKEAAAALFLSVHTVEGALKRVYRQLGVRSRTELSRRLNGVFSELPSLTDGERGSTKTS
jgi:DNA-binding CsgD family transcriptional regulator